MVTHSERSHKCSMRRTHAVRLDYGGHQGNRVRVRKAPSMSHKGLTEKGDIDEEKRVSERTSVALAWRLTLLLFQMANRHFLWSYVRESAAFVFKGQA